MTVLSGARIARNSSQLDVESRLPIVAKGDAALRLVNVSPRNHLDALDNGAHRVAQRASRAVLVLHEGQVGVLVELDGLIAGVVASHVTLAAVNAHLWVDQSHNVLPIQTMNFLKID